jgi:hypothetical protein
MNYELMTNHYELRVRLNRKQKFEITLLTELFGLKSDKVSAEFRMSQNEKHRPRQAT